MRDSIFWLLIRDLIAWLFPRLKIALFLSVAMGGLKAVKTRWP
jgi:hypothetical protein